MESNFEKDLQESEVVFKQAFNPNSILFHNGDPTPVPLGGQRIPNSMPTVYSDELKENEEKPPNYGPEYDRIFNTREFFNGLKKVLAKLTPPIEAILRHKETFSKSADPNNPTHLAKLKKSIDAEKEKIAFVIKELQELQSVIKQFPEYNESYVLNLNKIIENGKIDYQDKEQFTTYSFEVKNYSKDVFKEMGHLLDKIKAIKKEYEAKNKSGNVVAKTEKKEEEAKKE